MSKNIYVIIGEGRCGKSSLVRALTGIFRRGRRPTSIRQTNNELLYINVWPQSAQEAELDPNDVLDDINNAWSENILLVLRFQPHIIPYYAIDYISLITEHHNIIKVVFMGPGKDVQIIHTPGQTETLDKCMTNPVNENASRVRKSWGWL